MPYLRRAGRAWLCAAPLALLAACDSDAFVACPDGPTSPAVQLTVRDVATGTGIVIPADDVFVGYAGAPPRPLAPRLDAPPGAPTIRRDSVHAVDGPGGRYALAIRRAGFARWDTTDVPVRDSGPPCHEVQTTPVTARLRPAS